MRYFLLLCLSLSLFSCKVFKEPEFGGFEKVEFKKGEKGMNMHFSARIKNPNFYRMVLKKGTLQVTMNNNKIGDIDIGKKMVFKAKSETTQEFELQAGLGNLLMALPGLFNDSKIKVEGKVKGRAFIFSKTYNIFWESPDKK